MFCVNKGKSASFLGISTTFNNIQIAWKKNVNWGQIHVNAALEHC